LVGFASRADAGPGLEVAPEVSSSNCNAVFVPVLDPESMRRRSCLADQVDAGGPVHGTRNGGRTSRRWSQRGQKRLRGATAIRFELRCVAEPVPCCRPGHASMMRLIVERAPKCASVGPKTQGDRFFRRRFSTGGAGFVANRAFSPTSMTSGSWRRGPARASGSWHVAHDFALHDDGVCAWW